MLSHLRSTPQRMRQVCFQVLSQSARPDIEARLRDAGLRPSYAVVKPAEIGLVMVRGKAQDDGRPFNAGEITATRCMVRLASGQVGYGCVAGRDKAHAEIVAVVDALVQSDEMAQRTLDGVVAPLSEQLERRRRATAEEVAATKAAFFTLAQARGDD